MNSKKYLSDNPTVDVVFETTDGTLFYNKTDAINHAKTLSDNQVTEARQNATPLVGAAMGDEEAALAAATGDTVNTGLCAEPILEDELAAKIAAEAEQEAADAEAAKAAADAEAANKEVDTKPQPKPKTPLKVVPKAGK